MPIDSSYPHIFKEHKITFNYRIDLIIKVVSRDLSYKDNYFILNTKYLLKKIINENI